ncbi:MAG: hypothetical protein M1820_003830 [Bogoriella megaspora]|nr:MAG: hypothetical protein M1820_003830 [Bogoriella megaspora]
MPPVALVTGATSGIGLALVQHLLSLPTSNWHIILADINPPSPTLSLPTSRTLFTQTDVASWSQQSHLFSRGFAWHSRLDFIALNAGIDDRDDIFNSISDIQDGKAADTPPRKPNLRTFEVNQNAVYYGIKLSAYYLTRPKPEPLVAEPGKLATNGRIVITASSAGLYPLPPVPQYTASKHALVALTRSMAPSAAKVGITINSVCPAMVVTNLAPAGLLDSYSESEMTPMSSMMRAFEELGELEGFERGGRNGGWRDVGRARNGCAVEVSLSELLYREPPLRKEGQRVSSAEDRGELWERVYRERNRGFARRDWEGEGRGRGVKL